MIFTIAHVRNEKRKQFDSQSSIEWKLFSRFVFIENLLTLTVCWFRYRRFVLNEILMFLLRRTKKKRKTREEQARGRQELKTVKIGLETRFDHKQRTRMIASLIFDGFEIISKTEIFLTWFLSFQKSFSWFEMRRASILFLCFSFSFRFFIFETKLERRRIFPI